MLTLSLNNGWEVVPLLDFLHYFSGGEKKVLIQTKIHLISDPCSSHYVCSFKHSLYHSGF